MNDVHAMVIKSFSHNSFLIRTDKMLLSSNVVRFQGKPLKVGDKLASIDGYRFKRIEA